MYEIDIGANFNFTGCSWDSNTSTLTRTSTTAGYNTSYAISKTKAYSNGCAFSFRANVANKITAVGFRTATTAPTTANLNYHLRIRSTGKVALVNNTTALTSDITVAQTDVLQVEVLGTDLNLYVNGVLKGSAANVITANMYAYISMSDTGNILGDVKFQSVKNELDFVGCTISPITNQLKSIATTAGYQYAYVISKNKNFINGGSITFKPTKNNANATIGFRTTNAPPTGTGNLENHLRLRTTTGTMGLMNNASDIAPPDVNYAIGDEIRVQIEGNGLSVYNNGARLTSATSRFTPPLYLLVSFGALGNAFNDFSFTVDGAGSESRLNGFVKLTNGWKAINNIYIKTNGAWKQVKAIKPKINNEWKG